MSTDKKQALSAHLKAIRRMLIISVAAVAVLFVLFFYLLCGPLVDFVLAPVRARGIEVITTSVSEALMMQFKVCLIITNGSYKIRWFLPIIFDSFFPFVRRHTGYSTKFSKKIWTTTTKTH